LGGCEQSELAARAKLPEVSIEADEVLAHVRHGSRQPGIRYIVAAQLLVEAELTQLRPLRAQGRQLHTGRRQQRIYERYGILNRCFELEDPGAGDQSQKAGQYHRHQRQGCASPGCAIASSSQSRATA